MKAVVITYCKPCHYESHAARVASALRNELNITAILVPGKGGIFEVMVGGVVVAKRTRGQFPDERAIVAAVSHVVDAERGPDDH